VSIGLLSVRLVNVRGRSQFSLIIDEKLKGDLKAGPESRVIADEPPFPLTSARRTEQGLLKAAFSDMKLASNLNSEQRYQVSDHMLRNVSVAVKVRDHRCLRMQDPCI
jgi:hypothetical protein